jgi:hypothetical protein
MSIRSTPNLYAIGFLDVIARMRKSLAERAVVGENDQPRAVEVQAADGNHRLTDGANQIAHAGAALRIRHRGHETCRLVVGKINVLPRAR